jgi:iron(III) transport system substrate-binding protein
MLIFFTLLIALLSLVSSLGAAQTKPDGKEEWERAVAAARKEGEVTIYLSNYEPYLSAFRKEYPWLKVISVQDRGANLMNRITAERRAGKYIPDVIGAGALNYNVLHKARILAPIKPNFILPEVKDQSAWWGGKHLYLDPEEQYVFAYGGWPSWPMYFNTQLVRAGEIRSYWDVLNPKWIGKIISFDPTHTTISSPLQIFYYHPALGPEFMRKLFTGMNVTFSRDHRQILDWLAAGKFALCFACRDVPVAKKQGLPVDTLTGVKEGAYLSVGGATLSVPDRSENPNAAKVFINWFLSRQGQLALQRLGRPDDPVNSLRVDISKDDIPPENRLVEGGNYFDVTRPEVTDLTPILTLTKGLLREVEQRR